MKIGIFDSGLGGVTILDSIIQKLPDYDYYYYGDTKNLPYGDKSEEEVYKFSVKAMKHLFEADCVLVIIACNTASAQTLRRLQDTFLPTHYKDRLILGVVIPTIEEVVQSGCTEALLIATKRTVESAKFAVELAALNESIKLSAVATPELVPLIENSSNVEAVKVAIDYIDTNIGKGEVVILGCTHYCLLKDGLRAHYKNKIKIISQDEFIPDKLVDYLIRHPEIESKLTKGSERQIHLTKQIPDYLKLMSKFMIGKNSRILG